MSAAGLLTSPGYVAQTPFRKQAVREHHQPAVARPLHREFLYPRHNVPYRSIVRNQVSPQVSLTHHECRKCFPLQHTSLCRPVAGFQQLPRPHHGSCAAHHAHEPIFGQAEDWNALLKVCTASFAASAAFGPCPKPIGQNHCKRSPCVSTQAMEPPQTFSPSIGIAIPATSSGLALIA